MEFEVGAAKVLIVKGDITEQDCDAVVNAANPQLTGGGGVDGAIHRKGGAEISDECRMIRETQWPNGLPTGKAVITTGGNLKAKHVIHTVGPVWRGGDYGEPRLLADAYWNSLSVALDNCLKTIAFPSISTGAYGYPIEQASEIALKTVEEFLLERNQLAKVVFVLFSGLDMEIYVETARRLFGVSAN